jgi:hypothetical protein
MLTIFALMAGAAYAETSTTTLGVSDASPAYSETVTLTSTTKGSSGDTPATGTVSFYEDSGILLQTVNIGSGTAQWKQKFLAGAHTVYAVFSGNGTIGTSTSAPVAVNISSALAVPASGAYLGIRANPPLGSSQEAAIEVREGPAPNGIGRTFAQHLLYYGWKSLAQLLNAKGVFQPDTELQGDINHGRVPIIAWNCDSSISNSDSDIANGDPNEDANITASAQALAQYPGPVLLRWFWEFNDVGNNQKCRGDNGTPTQQTYDDFIAVWQRIWGLFQSAGATNVVFLWNPGHYNSDGGSNDPHGFYPGNTVVDWIGLDSYQRSLTATFSQNVQPFYNDFSKKEYGKPMLLGENGSQNWIQNNQELQWTYLQAILSDFKSNLFPQLKAYNYFDSTGPAGSWVLDDDNGQGNGGLAAFTILGANPLFAPMPGHPKAAKIGTYNAGQWYLDMNGNGTWDGAPPDLSADIGWPGATYVTGDWSGDGTEKIGVFYNGYWYLDYDGNGVWDGGVNDKAYVFGWADPNVIPVVGDWNGDGRAKIGVYYNGFWYLDYNGNGVWDGSSVDKSYNFGWPAAGVTPLVGDWSGTGTAKIGVYYNGFWYLDYDGNGVWNPANDKAYNFGWQATGVTPVIGDWNGNRQAKIGIYYNGYWYLDYDGNGIWDGGVNDKAYVLGWPDPAVTPILGDWSGTGTTKIGVFYNGYWYLDYNGNGIWDGPTTDKAYVWGHAGDTPIVGAW